MILSALTITIVLAFYIMVTSERKITNQQDKERVNQPVTKAAQGKWIKGESINNVAGVF